MTDEMNRLHDIASGFRTFLVPLWEDWHARHETSPIPVTPSLNMCRFTTGFLLQAMKEHHGQAWRVHGGNPWPPIMSDGGMCDLEGQWQPHYWLRRNGVIMDITADQFGYDQVLVLPANDRRYKVNYNQAEVSNDLRNAREGIASWRRSYRERDLPHISP